MNTSMPEVKTLSGGRHNVSSIALFAFKNFGLILSFSQIVISRPGIVVSLIIFLIGFCVDLLRRMRSPEFIKPLGSCSKNIREAYFNEIKGRQFKRKFFIRTASIYWLWWAYFGFFVFPFFILKIGAFDSVPLTQWVSFLPNKLYPFMNDLSFFQSNIGALKSASEEVQYLSVTWWFMILAIISEITGGAYYYSPSDVDFVMKRKKSKKFMPTRGREHMVMILIALGIVYSFPGLLQILGGSNAGGLFGWGARDMVGKIFPIFLVGFILLSSAGAIRYVYLNLLYQICGGFDSISRD